MYVYIKDMIKNKIKDLAQTSYVDEILQNRSKINGALCYGTGYKEYGTVPNSFDVSEYSYAISYFLSILCENVGMMNCLGSNILIPVEFSPTYNLLKDPDQNPIYGAVFYDNSARTLFLVWSGTSNLKMVEEDINTLPVLMPRTDPLKKINVHRGFLNIYERVRKNLVDLLKNYFNSPDTPCDNFVITGNSLGGGLSYISAYDLLRDKLLNIKDNSVVVYTFGSPRAGNINFAKSFLEDGNITQKILANYRIFNTEDLVVDVPPPAPKIHFTHVGDNVPFTYNSGKVVGNHIPCYSENLPR